MLKIGLSLLQDAFTHWTVLVFLTPSETGYQLHAKEIARTIDLSKYDGIVCVSGDGILVEVSDSCLVYDMRVEQ